MKFYSLLFALLLSTLVTVQAQIDLSPKQFLGYEIGTEFSRHSDVVDYFKFLANNSDYITYDTYGKTNERRPLTYAIISSPENLANIETHRLNNLKNIGITAGEATPEMAIVWLSYNVHGNEASSTEAAMNTAYKLITEHRQWLENTIIILDPCVNPDGRDRYANWYNQVKATPYNKSQLAIEHNEPWPGGRPNHYLFDLNRDWAWASQVESQQRIKLYNQWMPHIHVDFHEQGINEPYYFSPAAEPFHEIITPWQRDFQTEIGKNHAKYFDQEGWLYFTRERFDLLYPSYGDTYPTFMGAIGMTYEQAGHTRGGLGVQTDEGYELTLVDRVAHHTTTGLSTIEMASKNAPELNREFKKFFTRTNYKYKSYVVSGEQDRINKLKELLDLHEIKYSYPTASSYSGYHFETQKSGSIDIESGLIIATNQPKGNMVQVLFEPEALLTEPLTYDITAWSIPYAFGLDAIASSTTINGDSSLMYTQELNAPVPTSPGYISKWNSMDDAAFLAALLKNDIRVRFTERDVSFNNTPFAKGSLIITRSDNRTNENFDTIVTDIANKHKRKLYASPTSFADVKTDFGSPDIKLINNQNIAVLQGEGISSLSYGAVWHFFETQLHYPITAMSIDFISTASLSQFDVLVIPEVWYNSKLDEAIKGDIKAWIQQGGKVIALGRAVNNFAGKDGFGLQYKEDDDSDADDNNALVPYEDRERDNLKHMITGSIYNISLDQSHPMAFGYQDSYFTLKLGTSSFKYIENGYTVGHLGETPKTLSGFSGEAANKSLANSLIFGEARLGRGSAIYLVDDVLFRSFWQNGKLLFVNSLFFVNNNKFRI